jgi:hypothetical protein
LYIKVHEHKNICVYIYMNIDGASVWELLGSWESIECIADGVIEDLLKKEVVFYCFVNFYTSLHTIFMVLWQSSALSSSHIQKWFVFFPHKCPIQLHKYTGSWQAALCCCHFFSNKIFVDRVNSRPRDS